MQQNNLTKLSELCTRLEREFSLPRYYNGKGYSILQGDIFQVLYGLGADGREKLSYHDKIAFASFSDSGLAVYSVKKRYLSGQKEVLGKTRLGRHVLDRLEAVVEEHRLSELSGKKKNKCRLIARLQYKNADNAYAFIRSHILV